MCVLRPPSALRNHAGGDAGAVPRASSDHYEFLFGIRRQGTQGFLSSVLQNQRNRLAKVRQTFLARLALPIGAWHFSAVTHIPWAVLLEYRREFVAHFYILPPGVEPDTPNRIDLFIHKRLPQPNQSHAHFGHASA